MLVQFAILLFVYGKVWKCVHVLLNELQVSQISQNFIYIDKDNMIYSCIIIYFEKNIVTTYK